MGRACRSAERPFAVWPREKAVFDRPGRVNVVENGLFCHPRKRPFSMFCGLLTTKADNELHRDALDGDGADADGTDNNDGHMMLMMIVVMIMVMVILMMFMLLAMMLLMMMRVMMTQMRIKHKTTEVAYPRQNSRGKLNGRGGKV